jgi:CubicO group peptidase (beta-lactamase class C family)
MHFRLFSFFLLVCFTQAAKPQENRKFMAVEALLAEWNKADVPALSVAIVRNGKALYKRQYGMANIKEGVRNDPSSRFWIASVSKQFTAAGIYLLEQQKKLTLSQSISHYFPELPPIYQPVTIRHLVYHTSGIRDGFVLTALAKKPEPLYTNENVLKYISLQNKLNFSPGTAYEYNNSGYVLLALIIEKVSGLSFPVFMKESVFIPLGMKDTDVTGKVPSYYSMARGYHSKADAPGSFEEGAFQGDTYGSTGVVTTLNDLIRWAQVVQHPEAVQSFTYIIRQLLKAGELQGHAKIAYAGGLEKLSYKSKTVYEHFGADDGYKANVIYFPSTRLSVIGMTNNSSDYRLWGLLYSIADIMHDEKVQTPRMAEENEQLLSTTYYYNSENLPTFRMIKTFRSYAKVSTSPYDQGVFHKFTGDDLQSLDPIPTYKVYNANTFFSLDPYYTSSRRLTALSPLRVTDDLRLMEGEYVSTEIEASYKVFNIGNELFLEFAAGLKFPLFRLTTTDFVFEYSGPNFIQFTKDGFQYSREGVWKLDFQKQ